MRIVVLYLYWITDTFCKRSVIIDRWHWRMQQFYIHVKLGFDNVTSTRTSCTVSQPWFPGSAVDFLAVKHRQCPKEVVNTYRLTPRTFHRQELWRWSFSGVRILRNNFKPRFAFERWNRDYSWNKKLKKKTPIWISLMSENHWWYLFHKEVKSWDSTTWFRIWQFQTSAWKLCLQMHLLAERFVFLKVMIGVSWKRVSRPVQWHQCRLYTRQRFFCLYIYSLQMK